MEWHNDEPGGEMAPANFQATSCSGCAILGREHTLLLELIAALALRVEALEEREVEDVGDAE